MRAGRNIFSANNRVLLYFFECICKAFFITQFKLILVYIYVFMIEMRVWNALKIFTVLSFMIQ
jgi:hypothetical protein